MTIVDRNLDKVKKLCNQYRVAHLYVFGSALTDTFDNNSDVDFVVSFKDVDLMDYADNYFDFKFSLEDLFQRKVDLLEEKSLKNPFLKKSIDSSKRLVYG